jgi:hypothetical protein
MIARLGDPRISAVARRVCGTVPVKQKVEFHLQLASLAATSKAPRACCAARAVPVRRTEDLLGFETAKPGAWTV